MQCSLLPVYRYGALPWVPGSRGTVKDMRVNPWAATDITTELQFCDLSLRVAASVAIA